MNKHIHFIGILGSGISGVANLASEVGYKVTGCDMEAASAYTTTGEKVFLGHDTKHIKDADLVVVSPAVLYQNFDNPEIAEARRRKILITWQEFLGRTLLKQKKVICIAGTHGKSTTTAMAGQLLEALKFDPLVVVGALIPEWKSNVRFGKGEFAVIEADEFNDNFLNYSPEIVILNNVEFDHPDYFKNEQEVFASFKKFIESLSGDAILITNSNSFGISKLLGLIDRKINVIDIKDLDVDLKLKIPGRHNIENAKGVYALGLYLGIKSSDIKHVISGFSGIGRRMELIASKKGIEVYDDYAHHPTAIAATIQAIRESHPKARIWAIDEPHGFARTKALLNKYRGVFEKADRVIIGPIFVARDRETFGMSPRAVAEASGYPKAIGVDSYDAIEKILSKEIRQGDVILVMGAGKSYLWTRKIAKLIK